MVTSIESLLDTPLWEETYPAPQVMQLRLCILGDLEFGEYEPTSVVPRSYTSFTGSEISAGRPVEGQWMLGHQRLAHTIGVVEMLRRAGAAFEILTRMEKGDPVWRKLVRQNRREVEQMRDSVALQALRLLLAAS